MFSNVITLPLSGAHCGWKAGLRTEVAFDGRHFVISKPEILHVAERLTVLGPAHVHHKRLVAVANHALQLKPLDKIDLCPPAPRFECAPTDVIVVVCARKCEVIRQQDVERTPVLCLPCRIVFADDLVALRA
jgi:hypothetical protein